MSAPSPEYFRVDEVRDGDRLCLTLHGELDLESAPVLESKLLEAQDGNSKRIMVDLNHLQFMDSTGLRVILAAHQDAESNGHDFALRGSTPQVHRLLTLTGVVDRLKFED